jgi:hypothetical protein
VIRKINFQTADGTSVMLECDEKFLSMVREKIGLLDGEEITDIHIKHIFTEVIKGAAEA